AEGRRFSPGNGWRPATSGLPMEDRAWRRRVRRRKRLRRRRSPRRRRSSANGSLTAAVFAFVRTPGIVRLTVRSRTVLISEDTSFLRGERGAEGVRKKGPQAAAEGLSRRPFTT